MMRRWLILLGLLCATHCAAQEGLFQVDGNNLRLFGNTYLRIASPPPPVHPVPRWEDTHIYYDDFKVDIVTNVGSYTDYIMLGASAHENPDPIKSRYTEFTGGIFVHARTAATNGMDMFINYDGSASYMPCGRSKYNGGNNYYTWIDDRAIMNGWTQMTMSVWVRVNTLTDYDGIFMYARVTNERTGLATRTPAESRFVASVGNGSTRSVAYGPTGSLVRYKWMHLVMRWKTGSGVNMVLNNCRVSNGAAIGGTIVQGNTDTAKVMMLGTDSADLGPRSLIGDINKPIIWNAYLTDEECNTLHWRQAVSNGWSAVDAEYPELWEHTVFVGAFNYPQPFDTSRVNTNDFANGAGGAAATHVGEVGENSGVPNGFYRHSGASYLYGKPSSSLNIVEGTVSIWMRPTAAWDNFDAVFSHQTGQANGQSWIMDLPTGGFRARWGNGASVIEVTDTAPTQNVWTQYTTTYQASTGVGSLYKDGVLRKAVTNGSFGNLLSNTGLVMIAAADYGLGGGGILRHAQVDTDCAFISTNVYSAEQVMNLYNGGVRW